MGEIQEQASRRQSSLALALLLLSLAGCSADNPDISSRQRAEFEGSQFCTQYACRADGEVELQGGGLSRAYRVRGDEAVLIELKAEELGLFSASIGQYGQRDLRPDFRELATEFFTSAIGNCRAVNRALAYDLTRRLSAVMEARAHRCGPWEVRAGRVLTDYIITAERYR